MTTVDQVAPLDPAAAAPTPVASRLIGAIAVGIALLSATATYYRVEIASRGYLRALPGVRRKDRGAGVFGPETPIARAVPVYDRASKMLSRKTSN